MDWRSSLLAVVLSIPVEIFAQPVPSGVLYVASAPSGSCTNGATLQLVISTGTLYSCQSGTWAAISGGGGSTSITSSTGDLTVSPSPLTGTGTIDLNLGNANTWTGTQTFVAPALGTPASGVITNLTGTCTTCVAGGNGTVNTGTTPDGAYYASSTNAVSDAGTAAVTFGGLKAVNAGAASTPSVSITGAPFTGGNGTTTFPLTYLNSGGTAVTGFSTSGTFIGINTPSGFSGNFLDFWDNGTTAHEAEMTVAGLLFLNTGIAYITSSNDAEIAFGGTGTTLSSAVAANIPLKVTNAIATPTSDLMEIGFGTSFTKKAWFDSTAGIHAPTINTATQCTSAASPAVCAAAAAGFVNVAASATTVVVDTTAVTANSTINLTFDSSLGTALSVTCNTTINQPTVSARTAGTSFTITMANSITTNPDCISYNIVN